MTANRSKIPKTRERLLEDCESHLKFLAEALGRLHEPGRYKQVAGELRILVCKTRSNKSLLLDLLDSYNLEYKVTLPYPCPMVGGIHHKDGWYEGIDNTKIYETPFRDFIERGLAVYIKPYELSYQDLILSVADKMGGAHEDTSIDEAILKLEEFHNCGGFLRPLWEMGNIVLDAGMELIHHISKHYSYQPHWSGPRYRWLIW